MPRRSTVATLVLALAKSFVPHAFAQCETDVFIASDPGEGSYLGWSVAIGVCLVGAALTPKNNSASVWARSQVTQRGGVASVNREDAKVTNKD